MMAPTQQGEIRQRGRSAVCPMPDVMALGEAYATAGEPTAPVAMLKCPPQRGRDRPRPRADLGDAAVRVVAHDHAGGVARQTLRRFRGNVRPVLEGRLARRVRIGQDRSVDVDHDLVALACGAGVDAVVERGFGDEGEGVGPLLGHDRRFGDDVGGRFRGNVRGVSLLIQPLARRLERSQQDGADLGGQAAADEHHTVFILIHVQGADRVPTGGLASFGVAVHPAPPADDALDVLGGADLADGEETLFGLGSGDAGQRADLRVRQLAAGERLGEAGQRGERARHTDALASGAELDADAPRQPVGAGAEAGVPAGARVELADEVEQAGGGGVEVSGELGDLVAEAIQIRGGHRHFPPVSRLYTAIFEPRSRLEDERSGRNPGFSRDRGGALLCTRQRRAGSHS
jgi:hypothetical protein